MAVGSRDQSRASAFAAQWSLPKAYGSYEALFDDPDIDIVYIATTHPSHRDNAVDALNAGKHVLVEKPLAVDAAAARDIAAAAASANRFAGEAMWTKFLPKFDVIRQLLDDGALGEVRTVIADHGEFFTPDHRIYDPELAGGPLLDLGTYPIALAHMVFGSFTSVVAQSQDAAPRLNGQISAMLSDAAGNQALSAYDDPLRHPNGGSDQRAGRDAAHRRAVLHAGPFHAQPAPGPPRRSRTGVAVRRETRRAGRRLALRGGRGRTADRRRSRRVGDPPAAVRDFDARSRRRDPQAARVRCQSAG